jgi:putative protein kinase ArgK-like GTPase of G3E family
MGSSISGAGIEEMWQLLQEFKEKTSGSLEKNRAEQLRTWMHEALMENIISRINLAESKELIKKMEEPVMKKQKSPLQAADEAFRHLFPE